MDDILSLQTDEDWQVIAHFSDKEKADELLDLHDDLHIALNNYTPSILNYPATPAESLFKKHKDLLIEFYERPPKELKIKIQDRRNNHNLTSCPYCGNPYTPNTLDHFIPKDEWPEYSIYANNLVPQCSECAPIKGTHYSCPNTNTALFIHPVYFNLLSKIHFSVTIEFDAHTSTPTFNIRIKAPKIGEPEQNRIILHFQKLKIKERFITYCHRTFSRLKNGLIKNRYDVRSALTHRLIEAGGVDCEAKNWEIALYKGILNNDIVVTYLNSITPAEPNNEPLEELVLDMEIP